MDGPTDTAREQQKRWVEEQSEKQSETEKEVCEMGDGWKILTIHSYCTRVNLLLRSCGEDMGQLTAEIDKWDQVVLVGN